MISRRGFFGTLAAGFVASRTVPVQPAPVNVLPLAITSAAPLSTLEAQMTAKEFVRLMLAAYKKTEAERTAQSASIGILPASPAHE